MICDKCGGSGNDGSLEEMDCPKCDGWGEMNSGDRLAFITMPTWVAVMGAIVLIALLGTAHADVTQSNSNDILRNNGTAANATATAGAVSDVSVQANPQAVSSAISGDALSSSRIETGAVSNNLGPIQASSGPASAESGDVNSEINIEGDKTPRQAPGVALAIPPSTAPEMKCFGIGGSNDRGSTVTGWCWRARDAWAETRHDKLASLGLYTEAAKAYCSKRMHWRDFGSKAACEAGILQGHYDMESRRNNQALYEQKIREREQELEQLREKNRRMDEEMGGGKLLLADNSENAELKRIILEQERSIDRLERELDASEEDIDDLEDEVEDTEEQFRAWLQAREDKLAPLKRKYSNE